MTVWGDGSVVTEGTAKVPLFVPETNPAHPVFRIATSKTNRTTQNGRTVLSPVFWSRVFGSVLGEEGEQGGRELASGISLSTTRTTKSESESNRWEGSTGQRFKNWS